MLEARDTEEKRQNLQFGSLGSQEGVGVAEDSQELLKSFFLAFLFIMVLRGLVGYMFRGRVLMLRDERL